MRGGVCYLTSNLAADDTDPVSSFVIVKEFKAAEDAKSLFCIT